MTKRCAALLTITACILAVHVAVEAQRRQILRADAPVFLTPDAQRTPVRTLEAGASVTVIATQGDWTQIEFDDRQYGRRTGFVQTKFVASDMAAAQPSAGNTRSTGAETPSLGS